VVVLDSTVLLLLLDEKVPIPKDPATKKPYADGRERVEYLIDQLSESKTPILVPTPVLAEVLVRAGSATGEYLTKVRSVPGFRIGNFDQKAAVELALMTGAALKTGKKRGAGVASAPWQKVKFDRQIVAIAKSEQVTHVYSTDDNLRKLAAAEGMKAFDLSDLSMPPRKLQQDLPLEPRKP
jgi:predicted nucleic acid-binding protein